VTDAGLKEVGRFKGLQWLDLSGTRVTGPGLKELSRLDGLEVLNLSGTTVPNAGLKELGPLPKLRTLRLPAGKVTVGALRALRQSRLDLSRLQVLRELPVTDENLQQLAEVGLLHVLPNAWPHTTGTLRSDAQIYGLDLAETPVGDAALKALAGLNGLKILNLSDTAVTDAGLQELAALRGLRSLELRRTRVTDAGLRQLTGLHLLRDLHLAGTGVTDEGAGAFARALPDCTVVRPVDPRPRR
jgi:hypothetical protein